MKLLYPEFLWALSLLIIPIIIHLFNFRRYKTLYFSSLKFIRHVDKNANSTKNLKHLLVLLFRSLAFIFLVIAFAHPYIPLNDEAQNAGKAVVAIYIDNSNSMTARGTDGELLSEAREVARSLITKSPADTRFLINSNELSGIEGHLITKIDALDRIDKILPSALSRDLGVVLNWQKDIIQKNTLEDTKIGPRQYILLSDFQKNSSSLDKISVDSLATYYPVKLEAVQEENLYIDSVYFASPLHQQGQTSELITRIKNLSNEDLVNVELNFKCGTINRDIFVDIPANDRVSTSIKFTEKESGFIKGQVSVKDKQVTFDDTYYFSYEVRKNLNLLIIDFDDAVPNIQSVYGLDPFYKVNSVSAGAFTSDYLANKDLVVLNGINEVSSGLAETLSDFVESNGTLAIFPGTKLNKAQFNAWMSRINMPRLNDLVREGVSIRSINYADPFFKSIFEKKPDNINLPSVSAAYSQLSNSSAIPLLTLQNGGSLLYKSSGTSNVFLYTSSLKPDFGSFTSNALFPAIVLRIAELSQRNFPESIEIGSESKFPLYEDLKNDEPVKISNENVEYIPQLSRVGSISYLSLAGSEVQSLLSADNYSIKKNNQTFGFISLNYNRKESEIQSLSIDEVKAKMEESGVTKIAASTVSDGAGAFDIRLEKDMDRWKIFVLLALLFVLIEMFYLKFFVK